MTEGDFAPTPDGTIAIRPGTHDGRRVWLARVARIGEVITRRKSHFATCPNASEHRSAK